MLNQLNIPVIPPETALPFVCARPPVPFFPYCPIMPAHHEITQTEITKVSLIICF